MCIICVEYNLLVYFSPRNAVSNQRKLPREHADIRNRLRSTRSEAATIQPSLYLREVDPTDYLIPVRP